MNELLFFERREQDWKRLTFLCDRADASPSNLRSDELKEFVKLYRRVSADLALARTKSSNLQLIAFLNDLCARAYSQIYRPKRRGFWRAVFELPALSARTVRKRWRSVALSVGLFLGSAVLAYVAIKQVPETRDYFVPKTFENTFKHWAQGDMLPIDANRGFAGTLGYSSNNPMAALMTGALSAGSFGIMTVEILFTNGALLGALFLETGKVGRGPYLLVHILPHGVTELSGLILAAAAGFTLAGALIAPGRKRRGDALREAGKDAIVILATAILMMYIAAPIEGFLSFNAHVPNWARIAFASLSAVAWGTFWVGYARKKDDETVTSEAIPVATALD